MKAVHLALGMKAWGGGGLGTANPYVHSACHSPSQVCGCHFSGATFSRFPVFPHQEEERRLQEEDEEIERRRQAALQAPVPPPCPSSTPYTPVGRLADLSANTGITSYTMEYTALCTV